MVDTSRFSSLKSFITHPVVKGIGILILAFWFICWFLFGGVWPVVMTYFEFTPRENCWMHRTTHRFQISGHNGKQHCDVTVS